MIPISVLIVVYVWAIFAVIVLLDSVDPVTGVGDFLRNFLFMGLAWPIIPLIATALFLFEWLEERKGNKQ